MIPQAVMTTDRAEVLEIDPERPSAGLIARASQLLLSGALVVAPTDTKYALLCRADSHSALERIMEVKGRSTSKPISLFMPNVKAIETIAILEGDALKIARAFLPGRITLVLPAKAGLPRQIVANGKVGVRVSSSPVIRGILENVNVPLTATSANFSGSQELESINQISSQFGDQIPLYIDGGILTASSSSVIDCTDAGVKILRAGDVSEDDIKQALAVSKKK